MDPIEPPRFIPLPPPAPPLPPAPPPSPVSVNLTLGAWGLVTLAPFAFLVLAVLSEPWFNSAPANYPAQLFWLVLGVGAGVSAVLCARAARRRTLDSAVRTFAAIAAILGVVVAGLFGLMILGFATRF